MKSTPDYTKVDVGWILLDIIKKKVEAREVAERVKTVPLFLSC